MKSPKRIDETGNRYGQLTVLCSTEKHKNNGLLWLCRCDCGNEKEILAGALRRGKTMSCGCMLSSQRGQRYKLRFHFKPAHNPLDDVDDDILR